MSKYGIEQFVKDCELAGWSKSEIAYSKYEGAEWHALKYNEGSDDSELVMHYAESERAMLYSIEGKEKCKIGGVVISTENLTENLERTHKLVDAYRNARIKGIDITPDYLTNSTN